MPRKPFGSRRGTPPPLMSQPQLLMRRPAELPLPAHQNQARPRIRVATPEDATPLAALLGGAFPDKPWDTERAQQTFFRDPTVHTTFVATSAAGELLATATARVDPVNYPGEGYVHWVATHPAAQGRGLGRLLMQRVLQTFADLGLGGAVLETDDHRLPALRLYLSLGFEPVPWHESHPGRWEMVHAMLGPVEQG